MPRKQRLLHRQEAELVLRSGQHWNMVVWEHSSVHGRLVKLAPNSTLLKNNFSLKTEATTVNVLWVVCRIEQTL